MSQQDNKDSIIDASENAGFTSIEEVDLSDDDACKKAIAKLDSPRTLEALKILGMDKNELLPVSFDEQKQFLMLRDRTPNIPD